MKKAAWQTFDVCIVNTVQTIKTKKQLVNQRQRKVNQEVDKGK